MLMSEMNYRRERDGDEHAILFTYETRIATSADAVFDDMEQMLVDSRKSWMWPDEYSVHEPDQVPLEKGVAFTTTYSMKDPRSGEVTDYQYRYRLGEFDRQARRFQYVAQKGHPFPEGGATVTITPVSDNECMFRWDGRYTHNGNRAGAEEIFSWYFSIFFGAMEKNIKRHLLASEA